MPSTIFRNFPRPKAEENFEKLCKAEGNFRLIFFWFLASWGKILKFFQQFQNVKFSKISRDCQKIFLFYNLKWFHEIWKSWNHHKSVKKPPRPDEDINFVSTILKCVNQFEYSTTCWKYDGHWVSMFVSIKSFSAVSKNLKFFSQKVLILGRSPARRTSQRDMKKLGLCFWIYLNVRRKFLFMGLSKREIWTVLSYNVHKCEYAYCGLLLQSLFITFIDVYMNEHYHRFSEHTMKFIFMEYPHSWNKITTYCSLKPSVKVITRILTSFFEILTAS